MDAKITEIDYLKIELEKK